MGYTKAIQVSQQARRQQHWLPQSSTSFVKGSKEKLNLESDEYNNGEEHADVEEETEDTDEDDNECKKMIDGILMNRWATEK